MGVFREITESSLIKSEIRNPKQIQNSKKQCSKPRPQKKHGDAKGSYLVWFYSVINSIRCDFFRISDFGFRIYQDSSETPRDLLPWIALGVHQPLGVYRWCK
jgi:hypothetical protein